MSEKDTVLKLGELSRIDIPENERDSFAREFESILAHIGALESLTLDMSATPAPGTIHNVFRADGTPHETGTHTEAIVGAFPEKEGNSLKVKQILSYDE